MYRSVRGLAAAILLAAVAVVATPAQAATTSDASNAEVVLVAAVPDTDMSISIDGGPAYDLLPGGASEPRQMTPGKHSLTVTGEGPDWQMQAAVDIPAGGSDVVIHQSATPVGKPTVTVFRHPGGGVADDVGRVMLAHTAAIGPVDVELDGKRVFGGVTNGQFGVEDVPAGTHEVRLVSPRSGGPVLFGPVEVEVRAGALTSVYVTGDPRSGTTDSVVRVQSLPERGTGAPDQVDTGAAGLVEGNGVSSKDRSTGPLAASWWALLALGVLLVALAAWWLRRPRTAAADETAEGDHHRT